MSLTVKREENLIGLGSEEVLARTECYWICDERKCSADFRDRERKSVAPLLLMINLVSESFIHKLLFGSSRGVHENVITDTVHRRGDRSEESVEVEFSDPLENKIRCADFIVLYNIFDNVTEKTFVKKRGKNYGIEVLANDAVSIMKSYGYDKFHVFGGSTTGGIIAQYLIIHHPSHIISATISSSTPISFGDGTMKMKHDPNNKKEIKTLLAGIDMDKIFQNIHHEQKLNDSCVAELDGDEDGISKFDAWTQLLKIISRCEPIDRRPLLRKTSTPTLVIHGSENAFFSYEHGVALAEAIPGSELLTIEGGSVNLVSNSNYHDAIIERILALIYDSTKRDLDMNSDEFSLNLPPRFSVRYSAFELDIQTIANAMGEWTTKNSLTGSVISRSSKGSFNLFGSIVST